MFEKILVAHDGSDGAWKAFDAALDLAARFRAGLQIISVEEDLPRYAETMTEIDAEREVENTYYLNPAHSVGANGLGTSV
jgi:nucleotide-binding universal stress UspA family protein